MSSARTNSKSINNIARAIFFKAKQYSNTYQKNGLIIRNVPKSLKISIGDYSYGTIELHPYSSYCDINIGRYTSISDIKMIIGGNHHMDITTYNFRYKFENYPGESDNFPPRTLKIGHDVWIGYGAIVLDGANIETGAIIGAGTVVRGNVPPYAVVIGNPGTIVKYRFAEKEIEMLMKSEWWDLPKEALLKIENLLYSKDIETFVSKVRELKNAV